jgi:hypothetical protein
MKPQTHHICLGCHTPVARERYEAGTIEMNNCLVCPECEYAFLLAATPNATSTEAKAGTERLLTLDDDMEAFELCSKSA